jgi:hypothetical protein
MRNQQATIKTYKGVSDHQPLSIETNKWLVVANPSL